MRRIKILWVDDMTEWSNSSFKNLDIISKKYDVELMAMHAKDGEEVVKECFYLNFDVVLMDYNMEPFNGDKYIDDIRFEEHLSHIPIIFYSQDVNTDLSKLVKHHANVQCVYRGNLEDKVIEMFFEKGS